MARLLHLEVVTPDRVEYSGDVEMVVAPGVDGYLGIMAGHIPLVTRLQIGVLRILTRDEILTMAVSEGYLEVAHSRVLILAEAAELPEHIDVERALAAKRAAEEQLAHPEDKVNWAKAQIALRRALNRLKVAERK